MFLAGASTHLFRHLLSSHVVLDQPLPAVSLDEEEEDEEEEEGCSQWQLTAAWNAQLRLLVGAWRRLAITLSTDLRRYLIVYVFQADEICMFLSVVFYCFCSFD